MKFIYFLAVIFFSNIVTGFTQQVNSYVTDGMAYLNYTVEKSQGFNDIAAKYGINKSVLFAANNLKSNSVLQEGQLLKIPLETIINLSCSGANCTAVYYDVQQSEGLFRIGKNHGNIKVNDLKQLNKLKTEIVSKGMHLLVGYLNVNPHNIVLDTPVANSTAVIQNIAPKQAESSKTDSATNESSILNTHTTTAGNKQVVEKKNSFDKSMLLYNGKGFFSKNYVETGLSLTVTAKPFKSESGWNDGKFYLLMDSIPIGTVVKITNPVTDVFIYAKTLGALPHLKDKNIIKLRISNAGAAALGLKEEDHFEVILTY